MKVEKSFGPLLSNYEVLELLREQEAYQKSVPKDQSQVDENVQTIRFEALKYLQDSPCSVQNATAINKAITKLNEYKLTKAEKLQIINYKPRSPVDLHTLIEECEERFNEEQMDGIISLVESTLPAFKYKYELELEAEAEEEVEE
ncbi:hypothetical protein IWQ62_001476 [Dispira parvispora]|uniref:DNA-directed RNA polymerase III subunit RPC9 n=1 Tax=Dispira parvispora TaxID=1520584 RepID=A0A9W8ASA6_9FUNG|nr:hypothetical protein IWQ62_001476 [Dispira parvispora]